MKLLILVLGLHLASGRPTLQDLEMVDDTESVGSYVREVRAAPPENYHKSYSSDGDGEIGYSRKRGGGGKKGYQHFDSYHKKAGDNYEFEKQDSYGQDDEGHDAAHSHPHEIRAERYRESSDEDEHHEHEAEEKPKKRHEELREGDSDGNGGKEAYGHDPADYVLPEKYTYGSGEEYNF
ncbi:uncharacterized protein LOC121728628 [Aricia agestis]|uniref:uncharacterized protein LOC121728628 n=1 Tax=Aricia agestis TaxID=91739 RepID=UPI001C203EE2|nr:uncharacterized protein LOC121728628 [Aricia agestis]XP_041972764.1 uncharacterized protein LOC121728628 [Aricia agestis]